MTDAASPPDFKQALLAPISTLREATPERLPLLAKLGLRTLRDAVFFFPRDYVDFSDLRAIRDLESDQVQTVRGQVMEVDAQGSAFGRHKVGVLIRDDSDWLRAMWFNQPFMREKFAVGQRVQFSGKPRRRGGRWELAHPRIVWLHEDDGASHRVIEPVYSLTEGLPQHIARRVIYEAVDRVGGLVEEVFSPALLAQLDLAPIAEALPHIHRPPDHAALQRARRRFIFQELFVLQLALAARRAQQRVGFRAPPLPVNAQLDARIERLFPFELTAGQKQAINEVATDLASETPMNRLLQGDVGSGKTVVAVYALLACVANGRQAALMAPTEILARQHAATLDRLLRQSRVEYRLLVGGLTDGDRRATLAGLASGEIDLVIGTHALVADGVEFQRLGLVVIDEQHKFGVRQRAALRQGRHSPHYLVMTATPIPRTVSMTMFGDLDVTSLREMPPGRQEVKSYVVDPDKRRRWWTFVRNQVAEGRQAYVIAPLVEESASITAASVGQIFADLTSGELPGLEIDILHGRMTPREKEEAMLRFRSGATQVLVSTQVVEVGVDVPNATIITIASPERFGLSQLHQLRGRVGRGSLAGYCGLLVDRELAGPALERLEAFCRTTDGFALAELDFATRGPGDLFGSQQSGLPEMWIADLARDQAILAEARPAAQAAFIADPGPASPENAALRRQMLHRYGDALELGDVG